MHVFIEILSGSQPIGIIYTIMGKIYNPICGYSTCADIIWPVFPNHFVSPTRLYMWSIGFTLVLSLCALNWNEIWIVLSPWATSSKLLKCLSPNSIMLTSPWHVSWGSWQHRRQINWNVAVCRGLIADVTGKSAKWNMGFTSLCRPASWLCDCHTLQG